jgi:hypothetical protein
VFGYVSFNLDWDEAGTIKVALTVAGLPAVQYQGRITLDNWQQVLGSRGALVDCNLEAVTSHRYVPGAHYA